MNSAAIQTKSTRACLCALIPLAVGLTIYVAWLLTGWTWLEFAGFFTILGGLLFSVVGFSHYLAARRLMFSKVSADQRRPLYRRATLALALLFLNFPIAMALVGSVLCSGRPSKITIENKTNAPISDVSYFWGSNALAGDIEPISPGAIVTTNCRVPFTHFAVTSINYSQDGADFETTVTNRQAPYPWSPITFVIEEDRSVTTSEPSHVIHKVTKYLDSRDKHADQLIFEYGHWMSIERVTQRKSKWYVFPDRLGDEAEDHIHNASISLEGDEVRIVYESLSGGFQERRNFEDGELIERLINETSDKQNSD